MELRFPLDGDVALACYFVKANWPRAATTPSIEPAGKRTELVVKCDTQIVRDFQDTLTRAMKHDPNMARSARMLRMLLETKLAGRVIPAPGFLSLSSGQDSETSSAG